MALARELPRTVGEALQAARDFLSRSPTLLRRGGIEAEAEQIVAAAVRQTGGPELSRAQVYAGLADPISSQAGARALSLASSRSEGKLLQHLTGRQAFLDHEYDVGPDVLVPRPETEVLAAAAMDHLAGWGGGAGPRRGLEVGLGSGVLSIELLKRFGVLEMTASERSAAAIARAEANARRILGAGARRLDCVCPSGALDVLEPFAGQRPADFLISNPPYLASEGEADADVLAHEPRLALFAPAQDALHFYRRIAEGARGVLRPGAPVFLELPSERASLILALFEAPGWRESKLLPDLNGRERVLVAALAG